MKKKQGFTLIELVVACTLLIMLSTIATTTTDNFIQAVKLLKMTNQTLTYQTQVWSLKSTLAQAQLAYASELAKELASGGLTDPNAISNWNQSVNDQSANDQSVRDRAIDSLIQTLASYLHDSSGNSIPNITTFAGLLRFEGMYDPNNAANNPIIQLNPLTTIPPPPTPPSIAPLRKAPTVSQQGNSLYLPAVTWQGITL
jgi:type II secretory pathway pseudopilin PulG